MYICVDCEIIMPSAEFCTMTTSNHQGGPDFQISSKDVEGLVLEIKENLRLSAVTVTASSLKALPCSHISRKSSRASPYRVPSSCDFTIKKNSRRKQQQQDASEDPYELLQKLLKDGSLVNEAVRRVKLGLSPKQRYFYESDEESSPVILGLYADN